MGWPSRARRIAAEGRVDDPKKTSNAAAFLIVASFTQHPALAHGWNEIEDDKQTDIIANIERYVFNAIMSAVCRP